MPHIRVDVGRGIAGALPGKTLAQIHLAEVVAIVLIVPASEGQLQGFGEVVLAGKHDAVEPVVQPAATHDVGSADGSHLRCWATGDRTMKTGRSHGIPRNSLSRGSGAARHWRSSCRPGGASSAAGNATARVAVDLVVVGEHVVGALHRR